MEAGRWCSAAEVAADVSRAGGGVAPPAPRALVDACLAWGARPAPLILTETEAERKPSTPERGAPPPPDLRGITRMLRMVQTDYTDEKLSAPGGGGGLVISSPPVPAGRSLCSPGARTHHTTNQANRSNVPAVTSNLNPNVAEFVPKSVGSPSEGGRAAGSEGRKSAREREDLAARLRDDISNGSGRDKCSAIARLMRLYAEPEVECGPAPLLLTPDYFERPAVPERGAPDGTDGNSSRMMEHESVGSHFTSPTIRPLQPEGAADAVDVRASVDKVQRWLGAAGGSGGESPPARASPRLLLAPVTFRSRAPASLARTPPPRPAPTPAAPAYSPPARAAAALHREYSARAAAAAAQPAAAADTLWRLLEPQLRQKDAEWREREVVEP